MIYNSNQKQTSHLVTLGFLGLCLGLTIIFLILIPDLIHGLLLASLFAICAIPWLNWKSQPNLFAPVYFTAVFLTLIYPVRIFMLLLFPEYVVSYMPPPYDPGLVTKGLLYTIIGVVGYLFFYYNPPKVLLVRFKSISLQSSLESWPLKILIVYLAGWAVRIYQINTQNYRTFLTGEGHDPRSYTLLSYFSELSTIAFILMVVYWIKQRKGGVKSLLLLLAIMVPEATYALAIQGAKTHLVRLALFPVMAYYLVRKRMPAKILVPAVAFVILFVFPYVQTYRDIYIERFGEYLEVSLQEGLSITHQAVAEMYSRPGYYAAGLSADTLFWVQSLVIFLNRWAGFDGLAAILTCVPERFGYVYGKDLLLIPFALIPRAIWPDKPVSDVQKIFDQDITYSVGSSTSPYPIAEGYFNGGLAGIILVMASIAILQRVLYSGFFLPRRENPLAIAVYIWLFLWVIWIDSWVLPMYVYLLQRAAIMTLVCLFMIRPAWLTSGRTLPMGWKQITRA